MPSGRIHTFLMATRLEKYRAYMAGLDPTDAQKAIERGLYVRPPGRSVADRIAARAHLQPGCAQALVGGIGSGKTTQLLIARDGIQEAGDTRAIYVDVAEKHQLAGTSAGVLAIAAGLALGEAVESPDQEAKDSHRRFQRWAHGENVWVPWEDPGDWEPPDPDDFSNSSDPEPGGYVTRPGRLVPPQPPVQSDVQEMARGLRHLREALARDRPHLVLLFDSLDRLADPDAFARLVEQDIRVIRSAGIGVVVVAPLRAMFGRHRVVLDRFDEFHHQPPVDVQADEAGRLFLTRVLETRAPSDILRADARRRIVELSGGVLRDLVSLARQAGEEAYMGGAETIAVSQVEAAADAFGRKHLLGLKPEEIAALQRVRSKRTFVQTSDDDLALLATRRVLEYRNGDHRYAVHPTLVPLLEQLAVAP